MKVRFSVMFGLHLRLFSNVPDLKFALSYVMSAPAIAGMDPVVDALEWTQRTCV